MGYWQEEELRRTKKILTGSKTALIAVIITVFTLVLGGQKVTHRRMHQYLE